MRWKRKMKPFIAMGYKSIEPNIGDKKQVTKFAWFPTKMKYNKSDVVWLEYYVAIYKWEKCTRYVSTGFDFPFDEKHMVEYYDWVLVETNLIN